MFRDFSNYDVCEDGLIWSKSHKKFLKPATTKDGYQQVCLYDNEGKKHSELVHRVVFCAVNGLWEIPEGFQINHKNEFQKHQNAIWNLELVTPKQNINYGTRNSRVSAALTNRPDKSKRVAAFKNGELVMVFPSIMEAHRNGYSCSHVCSCCRGERKIHKGFEWRYLDDDN